MRSARAYLPKPRKTIRGMPSIPGLCRAPPTWEDRPTMSRVRLPLAITIAVKTALVGLLVFGALRQDLSQFHGKAMTGRALTYPIAALIVPAIVFWRRRTRPTAYPYDVDVLIVLPFLIDVIG